MSVLTAAAAASAVKRAFRSGRDRVRDRIEAWRYDPPETSATAMIKVGIVAVVAVALFGWWMHRQGYREREADFRGQKIELQGKVAKKDATDNAAEAAEIARLRAEQDRARRERDQALDVLRRTVLEPQASSPESPATVADLNAVIRRVSP